MAGKTKDCTRIKSRPGGGIFFGYMSQNFSLCVRFGDLFKLLRLLSASAIFSLGNLCGIRRMSKTF
jgi:hypothetical protein